MTGSWIRFDGCVGARGIRNEAAGRYAARAVSTTSDDQQPDQQTRRPSQGFVWPPRGARRQEVSPSPATFPRPELQVQAAHSKSPTLRLIAPAPAPRGQSALARMWAEIEHAWLDVTAPPLAQRMVEEFWVPDAPAEYCRRCGLSIERHARANDGQCSECRHGETARPPWQRLIRLGEYESPLSQWICEVKFTRWRKLGRGLGHVLGDSILAEMENARVAGEIPESPPLIVSVPMSLPRRLARGIDHTLAVARGVADRTGGEVVQPIRRDHRPSQTHVAPSRRQENVANTFHPRAPWLRPKLAGRLVIVVDDVTTTTSTLRAACRAVLQCDREERARSTDDKGKPLVVWSAVLARTPPDSHDLVPDRHEFM